MENLSYSNKVEDPNYFPPILASRGDRFLAQLIDGGIIVGVGIVSVLLGTFADPNGMVMIILFGTGLLSLLVYQAYLLSTRGQTIGKQAMKIKIIRIDTEENGGFVYNFLLRGVVNRIIAGIVPLYGLIDILLIFSENKRCIHDRIAGTIVVVAF